MTTAVQPVATLDGVTVDIDGTRALDAVDLVVAAGERVALVGPSGAGKTTLLRVLRGSVAPTAGTARVLGTDPVTAGAGTRQRVGAVHQQLHLAGPLQVVHNVNAGRLARWSLSRALWSLVRPQEQPSAAAALARVGIRDALRRRTDELSGGEQQRVAIARVLVQDPDLVLADEPVASLDPARAAEIVTLLCDLCGPAERAVDGPVDGRERALVVSLHAFALARRTCDRVVGLRAGRVVFDVPAGAVTDAMATELYDLGAV